MSTSSLFLSLASLTYTSQRIPVSELLFSDRKKKRNDVLDAVATFVNDLSAHLKAKKDLSSHEAEFLSFVKPLVYFQTTTELGLESLLLLVFPPTYSQRKQNSLLSRTISELVAQQLKRDQISIVELFP